jgi:hypothetical protein
MLLRVIVMSISSQRGRRGRWWGKLIYSVSEYYNMNSVVVAPRSQLCVASSLLRCDSGRLIVVVSSLLLSWSWARCCRRTRPTCPLAGP